MKIAAALRHYGWEAALFGVLAGFVALKLPVLGLPFFWDEAWSYAPGVRAMYEHGPSLMPGSIPADLYRGHPLFFYFFASSWMEVFGDSIRSQHVFALTVSVGLLTLVYFVGKSLWRPAAGLVACLMLMAEPAFFTQSVFLLPEVLVALLVLGALWGFSSGKITLYVVSMCLLLLTKESGLTAMIAVMVCWTVLRMFTPSNTTYLHSWWVFSPLAAFAGFFIIQRVLLGWFFFPEHIGMMNLDFAEIINKLKIQIEILFMDGIASFLMTLLLIAGLRSWYLKRRSLSGEVRVIILVSGVFTVGYVAFSAINFWTPRYLLAVYPLFALLTAGALVSLSEHFRLTNWISLSVGILVLAIGAMLWHRPDRFSDVNMAYADMTRSHQRMVHYCEAAGFQDSVIYTHFLMANYMGRPACGYLSRPDNPFNKVYNNPPETPPRFVIVSSVERTPELEAALADTLKTYRVERVFQEQKAETWLLRRR